MNLAELKQVPDGYAAAVEALRAALAADTADNDTISAALAGLMPVARRLGRTAQFSVADAVKLQTARGAWLADLDGRAADAFSKRATQPNVMAGLLDELDVDRLGRWLGQMRPEADNSSGHVVVHLDPPAWAEPE